MRARGFTLIELMVASAIGLIILTGATALATAMVRSVRSINEQMLLSTRSQMAQAVLLPTLSSAGFGWNVTSVIASPFTSTTGSFGAGHCVSSTNLCTGNTRYPVQITDSTTAADALSILTPVDGSIESVQIRALNGNAPIPTNCTSSSMNSTVTFDVQGTTTRAWSVGDLVLISHSGHVTVSRVGSAFSTNTTMPLVTRQLTLDMGTNSNLQYDDGGSAVACSADGSLRGAKVFRIAEVRLRTSGGNLEMAVNDTASEVTTPSWLPVVQGVDDLQFRIVIARIPRTSDTTGTASQCTCNGSAFFDGASAFGTSCTCTATDRLNEDPAAAPVYRVLGFEVGVLMSGDQRQATGNVSYSGLFNRSGVVATDTRMRQKSVIFVGMPNAYAL